MSDLISAKNKLRLHLRKARQKTIKNLKRDCAKYKNDEHIKLLSQVKEKTDLSTVFQTVINCKSKDFEELLSGLDSEFEKRIIKALISNSEIKELVENLWQELSAFQGKTTKNKTLGEKLEDVAKIKKVDESSIERPKPEKTNTPKLTRKEKLAQKLAKKVPKNVAPRINDDSSSSDDDFFENPKRPKIAAKNEEEELKLDFIGHSRYSKDRKRNYQEKRDFVLNQKEEEKKNSAAHKRSHKHIIEGVAHKLHPSWQAKIDAKKSLEAGGAVNKNKRIKFDDSDSE